MNHIILIEYSIIFIIIFVRLIYKELNLLQQSHYKTFYFKNFITSYYFKNLTIPILFPTFIFFKSNYLIKIGIGIILLLTILKKEHFIIPLKITKRMSRIIIIFQALFFIPHLLFKQIVYLYLMLLFIPFLLSLSLILLFPVECLVNSYYKKKAIKKIKKVNPFIICITGSFGKTSVKNILYQFYQDKYQCIMTPKSYNTLGGVCKTILNDLTPLTELFIVEAGATKPHDIEKIVSLLHPDIGIITSIGYQHMTTFKTIDTVLKTKWELAQGIKSDGYLIINEENRYLQGQVAYNVKETIGVGGPNSNIIYEENEKGMRITNKKSKKSIDINTLLLGKHNLLNISLSYAATTVLNKKGFKLSKHEIIEKCSRLNAVEHRLEKKKINEYITLLDDSFNSNQEGFKNALEVLKKEKTKKILITPGLVDCSTYLQSIYSELVEEFIGIDEIYIIEHKESRILIRLLKEKNIPFNVVHSFDEAYQKLIKSNELTTILIENDLPDHYLRRTN